MFHDNHHGDGILGLWCAAPPGVQAELVERGARPVLPARVRRPPRVDRRAPRSQARLGRGGRDRRRRVPHRRGREAREAARRARRLNAAAPERRRGSPFGSALQDGLGLGDERDELVERVAQLGLHHDRRSARRAAGAWSAELAFSHAHGRSWSTTRSSTSSRPRGRLRNAHTAPSVSASVITAPPCIMPAVVQRSGDHGEAGVHLAGRGRVELDPARDGERHHLQHGCEVHRAMLVAGAPGVQSPLPSAAVKITDVEHRVVDIDPTRAHAYNQVNVRRLRSGDLVAVYNEERFPYHHDSGQTVMLRSRDGGDTWTDRTVVLPYTDTTGNWDCGICELDDGTLLVEPHDRRVLQARHPARAAVVDARPAYRRARRLDVELQDDELARRLRVALDRRRRHVERADPGERAAAQARGLPARLVADAERVAAARRVRPHPRLRRGGRERVDPLRAAALRRRRLQLGVLLHDGVRRREHRRLRGARDRAARRRPHRRDAAHARESERRREEHGDRGVGRRRLLVDAAAIHATSGVTRPSSRRCPTAGSS